MSQAGSVGWGPQAPSSDVLERLQQASFSWERARDHLPGPSEAFYNGDAVIKVPLLCNRGMFDAHCLMHR